MTLCHMCTVCPNAPRYTSDLIWLGGLVSKVYMYRQEMYVQLFTRWLIMTRGESSVI